MYKKIKKRKTNWQRIEVKNYFANIFAILYSISNVPAYVYGAVYFYISATDFGCRAAPSS